MDGVKLEVTRLKTWEISLYVINGRLFAVDFMMDWLCLITLIRVLSVYLHSRVLSYTIVIGQLNELNMYKQE